MLSFSLRKNIFSLKEKNKNLKGKFSISSSPIFPAFSSFSLFLEYCLHGYSPNQYVLAGWGNNCVLKSQKSFALSGI